MRQTSITQGVVLVTAFGAFTFVLHSHLPYARLAGRWPHGEEWIHEAATETYLPLLQALYDLKEEGIKYKITIGITPILAEQLADADVLRNLNLYIDDKIERAHKDLERFTAGPRASEDEDDDLYGEEDEDEDFDDDFEDDDLDDEDFEDDDFEDDEDEEEDDLYAKKKAIPVTEPEWWVGNPQMIELAKYYQNFFEGTKRALLDRFKGDILGAFKALQDEGYIE